MKQISSYEDSNESLWEVHFLLLPTRVLLPLLPTVGKVDRPTPELKEVWGSWRWGKDVDRIMLCYSCQDISSPLFIRTGSSSSSSSSSTEVSSNILRDIEHRGMPWVFSESLPFYRGTPYQPLSARILQTVPWSRSVTSSATGNASGRRRRGRSESVPF